MVNNHFITYFFGVAGAVGGGVTIYPLPGSGTAAQAAAELKIPLGRTIPNPVAKNLRVKMATAPGGAVIDTITVRTNGVDQALTCTVNAANTIGSDLTNTFLATGGNDFSVKYVSGAGSAAANVVISFEIEFPW